MKGQIFKAKTPKQYIAALKPGRREEIARIDQFIRESLPKKGFEAVICEGVLGYGPYHYKYASGREGDSCRIALASNKSYISMYVLGCDGQENVAERYKKQLPKASIGKCCVRFKKFDDLDPKAVRAMLKEAAKSTAAGEASGK